MLVLLVVMVCEYCSAVFDGRKRRFCDDRCRYRAWYLKRTGRESVEPTNTCRNCGRDFDSSLDEAGMPVRGRARLHCSDACRRAWSGARSAATQRAKVLTRSLHCVACGEPYESRLKQSKYCCAECRLEYQKFLQRQKYLEEVAKRPETKITICGWCEKELVVPASYHGRPQHHDGCRTQARRARNRQKTLKRQGYRTDYLITHEEIAQRDGFLCHICLTVVDMCLPRTSRYGATLDHVIPISLGGKDSFDNLKLAHWICNIKKSNKLEPAYA